MSSPTSRTRPLYCIGQNGQQGFPVPQNEEHSKLLAKYAKIAKEIYRNPPNPPEKNEELRCGIKKLKKIKWQLIGECTAYLKVISFQKLLGHQGEDAQAIAQKYPFLSERATHLLLMAQLCQEPKKLY